MFGIGWPELLLIGIVAVIVIGPKELPPLMRQVGKYARTARGMWDEMRGHIDDLTNEVDLEESQRTADTLQKKTNAKYLRDDGGGDKA